MCSWKGQLEKSRNWKVLSWKVWKTKAKLEIIERSWKELSEVRNFFPEFENFAEVGKFRCIWKVLAQVGKYKWTRTVITKIEKCHCTSDLGGQAHRKSGQLSLVLVQPRDRQNADRKTSDNLFYKNSDTIQTADRIRTDLSGIFERRIDTGHIREFGGWDCPHFVHTCVHVRIRDLFH